MLKTAESALGEDAGYFKMHFLTRHLIQTGFRRIHSISSLQALDPLSRLCATNHIFRAVHYLRTFHFSHETNQEAPNIRPGRRDISAIAGPHILQGPERESLALTRHLRIASDQADGQ